MKLSDILNFINKNSKLVLMILCVIMFFLYLRSCDKINQEKANNKLQKELFDNNLKALNDTIKETYNKKLQATEFDKQTLVLELKDLKKYNQSLYNDIKKIKGDVMSILESGTKTGRYNVAIDNQLIKYNDNLYGLKFKDVYQDSGFYQKTTGVSKFKIYDNNIIADKTILDTNETSIKVAYGFRENDKTYEVFAISKSPIVKIDQLSGSYFIDKQVCKPEKRNPWHFGPYIGVGINSNLSGGNIQLGYNVGIGLQYDIFNKRTKSIFPKTSLFNIFSKK